MVPRSSRSKVVGFYGDALKIKLKVPPVDNEANDELIKLLANLLNVPRSNIEIVKGHKQKRKVLSISGVKDLKCLYENL